MTDITPMLGLWFGNFFEPFYSDEHAVRRGIAAAAELGFNCINLDSKPWEDFFARYRGEPASPYVAMQELMMREIVAMGLKYTHLALYLCGDNLYPTIRDVPPVRGEEAICPDGRPMGTYKYWSPKAQQTMVDHVKGLLGRYRPGMWTTAEQPPRVIMQTMFEPIPKPSFDAEGRQRYLAWLEGHYQGDIHRLNNRYLLDAISFKSLRPQEYWLRPEELTWVDCARPSAADFARRTGDFYRWIDNQTYLAHELEQYLAAMKRHWQNLEVPIFIEPVLHQWGYFFNPPGQTMWQTGQRALDVYRCSAHVDGALFIAAPLNAENLPDAMALSVEASIMRCANDGRAFTAGLYLGRHINGDIYRTVPPAEAIGTLVAHGARRLHVYGYSGLDDGGVLYRMDATFKSSLRVGNRWAAEVIPLLTSPRTREAAILFPAEMSLYEPLEVDENGRHRMDLLGWYAQLVDLGWHVDIIHPMQAVAGALQHYRWLIAPHNSLYDLGDNAALEKAVKNFVNSGGGLVHGPHCELARRSFGVQEQPAPFDGIAWREKIIPHGWSTVAYVGGAAVGTYLQSGKKAIARMAVGQGQVISFGFEYGYAYSRRTMPIVPPQYGRTEMHPINLLERTPAEELLGKSPQMLMEPVRGVEVARFGNHVVVVNHRGEPVDIGGIRVGAVQRQIAAPGGWLAGHSAACLTLLT
ncbi:MAG: hypothetical protein HKL96_11215 [Phycisphaerales bacterium]|nr:hypothetical protein [Phycisphaerales bacterium]